MHLLSFGKDASQRRRCELILPPREVVVSARMSRIRALKWMTFKPFYFACSTVRGRLGNLQHSTDTCCIADMRYRQGRRTKGLGMDNVRALLFCLLFRALGEVNLPLSRYYLKLRQQRFQLNLISYKAFNTCLQLLIRHCISSQLRSKTRFVNLAYCLLSASAFCV